MIARVSTKVGNTTYQFEADDKEEIEAIHKAVVLGNPPQKCDECGNEADFKMDTNKDKEANTYVNVVCLNEDCRAKAKLGQYKAGGFFWHKFVRWIGKDTEEKLKTPVKKETDDEAIEEFMKGQ